MAFSFTRMERDALIFHAAFSLLCLVVLLLPVDAGVGWRLFALVAVYNACSPLAAALRKHGEWLKIWFFSVILSVLQVFPDWFLSAQLNVLVFPEDGFAKIGTVSSYMAGLWAVPFVVIVLVGRAFEERHSSSAAYRAVALASLLVFGISEQTVWLLPSWYAQNVKMIGHAALYILVPEMLLGLAVYFGYGFTRGRGIAARIAVAFLIMQLYLGSAAFFYFLVEKVLGGM